MSDRRVNLIKWRLNLITEQIKILHWQAEFLHQEIDGNSDSLQTLVTDPTDISHLDNMRDILYEIRRSTGNLTTDISKETDKDPWITDKHN